MQQKRDFGHRGLIILLLPIQANSVFCVFECEVQVGTSTATTVACQRDDDAGTDVGAFGVEGTM